MRYLLVPIVTLTALVHTFAPVVKTAIAGFGVL